MRKPPRIASPTKSFEIKGATTNEEIKVWLSVKVNGAEKRSRANPTPFPVEEKFCLAPLRDGNTVKVHWTLPANLQSAVLEIFSREIPHAIYRKSVDVASREGKVPFGEMGAMRNTRAVAEAFIRKCLTAEHSPYQVRLTVVDAQSKRLAASTYFHVLIEQIDVHLGKKAEVPFEKFYPHANATELVKRVVKAANYHNRQLKERNDAVWEDLYKLVKGEAPQPPKALSDLEDDITLELDGNAFGRSRLEWHDNTAYRAYAELWNFRDPSDKFKIAPGPRISLAARALIQAADGKAVFEAPAVGKVRLFWDWFTNNKDALLEDQAETVKAFLKDALDYKIRKGLGKESLTSYNAHLERGGRREAAPFLGAPDKDREYEDGKTDLAKVLVQVNGFFSGQSALSKVIKCDNRTGAVWSDTSREGGTARLHFQPCQIGGDAYKLTVYLAQDQEIREELDVNRDIDPGKLPAGLPIATLPTITVSRSVTIHLWRKNENVDIATRPDSEKLKGFFKDAGINLDVTEWTPLKRLSFENAFSKALKKAKEETDYKKLLTATDTFKAPTQYKHKHLINFESIEKYHESVAAHADYLLKKYTEPLAKEYLKIYNGSGSNKEQKAKDKRDQRVKKAEKDSKFGKKEPDLLEKLLPNVVLKNNGEYVIDTDKLKKETDKIKEHYEFKKDDEDNQGGKKDDEDAYKKLCNELAEAFAPLLVTYLLDRSAPGIHLFHCEYLNNFSHTLKNTVALAMPTPLKDEKCPACGEKIEDEEEKDLRRCNKCGTEHRRTAAILSMVPFKNYEDYRIKQAMQPALLESSPGAKKTERPLAHEIGHHLFLPHTKYPEGENKPKASKSDFHTKDDEDCLMGYHYEKEAVYFCGYCNLRLRGWSAGKHFEGPQKDDNEDETDSGNKKRNDLYSDGTEKLEKKTGENNKPLP